MQAHATGGAFQSRWVRC